MIAQHSTRMGESDCLTHNPWNAVSTLGHRRGYISMWTPNMSTEVVKILAHKAPVHSISIDTSGKYMVSSGADGKIHIWDLRKYQTLFSYSTPNPATSLSISQTGLLGLAFGPHVQVWKDLFVSKQERPYMQELVGGKLVRDVQFVPYEDFLCVGHSEGIKNLVIPGAGQAVFDSFEANPFESRHQRREREVRQLLEKLQPETIVLDPNSIGRIDTASAEIRQAEALERKAELSGESSKQLKEKDRKRGRNTSIKNVKRRQASNIIESRAAAQARSTETEEKMREAKNDSSSKSVLDRFL